MPLEQLTRRPCPIPRLFPRQLEMALATRRGTLHLSTLQPQANMRLKIPYQETAARMMAAMATAVVATMEATQTVMLWCG